ncbi:MAG: ABC transporter ATP-binding protein, partial [Legionellales bacterium]|nr:ABC transporter ATP-binding protein [Legionellales bacterium]
MRKTVVNLQNINLSISSPGIKKNILSNIDYKIYSGDFIIILGDNGSGKS